MYKSHSASTVRAIYAISFVVIIIIIIKLSATFIFRLWSSVVAVSGNRQRTQHTLRICYLVNEKSIFRPKCGDMMSSSSLFVLLQSMSLSLSYVSCGECMCVCVCMHTLGSRSLVSIQNKINVYVEDLYLTHMMKWMG